MEVAASGFTVINAYIPPDGSYIIEGPDSQILSITLKPGEKVTVEPGGMKFMSEFIKPSISCVSISRYCSGEPCCKVDYTNTGNSAGFVGLAPIFAAKIIPIQLSEMGRFITRRRAYMSSLGDVNVSWNVDCGVTGFCGYLGCCRQQVTGTGTAFIQAGGTVLAKKLQAGETLNVDRFSILGFQDTVNLGLVPTGGPLTCCCAGEGCCLTTVTGPGHVYLQSSSIEKLYFVTHPANNGGGGSGGGGGE